MSPPPDATNPTSQPPKRYASQVRDEQARRTRRAIVTAAHDLFLARGYAATTIDGIAEAAHVSRRTVFNSVGAGMVGHWRRVRGASSTRSILVNGLGAVATGITVVVVLVAKFVEGAWITILLIPGLFVVMGLVRRHYHHVSLETRSATPLELNDLTPPLVILPIQNWSHIVKKALRFALKISPDIRAVHVDCGEGSAAFHQEWNRYVEEPTRQAGVATPQLVVVPSRYRLILAPIVEYVLEAERCCPNQQIAVLIPELVQRRWYHHLLHNKRASVLKALLLLKGNQRIIVINVPWYLES